MVVTPEYEQSSGSWDPPEPPEYGCDVFEVEADSKRTAMILAVRHWRQQRGRTYVTWCSDECPFTGLKVYDQEQLFTSARHQDCDCMSCRPWTY